MPLLKSERINLRAIEPEDLEILYQWENDTSLWELGSTLSPYSRFMLKQYIANASVDIYEQKQIRLIIELNNPKCAVGTIDLYDFDPHHRRAGVGILVDTQYHRQGIGKEAIKLLIDYAFDFLKMHQIYAYIPQTNTPSLRLFEQSRFYTIGVLPDWLLTKKGYTDVCMMSRVCK